MPFCRCCAVDSSGALLLRRRPHVGKLWRWAREHDVDSDDGVRFFPELLEILSAGIGEIVAEIPDLSDSPNYTIGGSSGSTCISTRCSSGSPSALIEEQSPKDRLVRSKPRYTRADLRKLEEKENPERLVVKLVLLSSQVHGVADHPHGVGWTREHKLEEVSEELSNWMQEHRQAVSVPETFFPPSKRTALQRLKERKTRWSICRENTPNLEGLEGSEAFGKQPGATPVPNVPKEEIFKPMDGKDAELTEYDERILRLREISMLWDSCERSLKGCESLALKFRDPLEHISVHELRKVKDPIDLANENKFLEIGKAVDDVRGQFRSLHTGWVCRALRRACSAINTPWSRQVEHQLSVLELKLTDLLGDQELEQWKVLTNLDEWGLRGKRCFDNLKDRLDVAFAAVRADPAKAVSKKSEEEEKSDSGPKRSNVRWDEDEDDEDEEDEEEEEGTPTSRRATIRKTIVRKSTMRKSTMRRSTMRKSIKGKTTGKSERKTAAAADVEAVLAKRAVFNHRRGSHIAREEQEMASWLHKLDCMAEGFGTEDEFSKWFKSLTHEAQARWFMFKFQKNRSVGDNWIDEPARYLLKLEERQLELTSQRGLIHQDTSNLQATLSEEANEVVHHLRKSIFKMDQELIQKAEERQHIKEKMATRRITKAYKNWKTALKEYQAFVSRNKKKKTQAKDDFELAVKEWRSDPNRTEKLAKKHAIKGGANLDALIDNEQRPLNVRWEAIKMQQQQYMEFLEEEVHQQEKEHSFLSGPVAVLESIHKVLAEASDGVPQSIATLAVRTKSNMKKLRSMLERSKMSIPAMIPLCTSLDEQLERLDRMLQHEQKLLESVQNENGLLARLTQAHDTFKKLMEDADRFMGQPLPPASAEHPAASNVAPVRTSVRDPDFFIQLRNMLHKAGHHTAKSQVEGSSLQALGLTLGEMVTSWLSLQEHRSILEAEIDALIKDIKKTEKDHYEKEKKRILDQMCHAPSWKAKRDAITRARQEERGHVESTLAELIKRSDSLMKSLEKHKEEERQEREAAELLRSQVKHGEKILIKVRELIDKRLGELQLQANIEEAQNVGAELGTTLHSIKSEHKKVARAITAQKARLKASGLYSKQVTGDLDVNDDDMPNRRGAFFSRTKSIKDTSGEGENPYSRRKSLAARRKSLASRRESVASRRESEAGTDLSRRKSMSSKSRKSLAFENRLAGGLAKSQPGSRRQSMHQSTRDKKNRGAIFSRRATEVAEDVTDLLKMDGDADAPSTDPATGAILRRLAVNMGSEKSETVTLKSAKRRAMIAAKEKKQAEEDLRHAALRFLQLHKTFLATCPEDEVVTLFEDIGASDALEVASEAIEQTEVARKAYAEELSQEAEQVEKELAKVTQQMEYMASFRTAELSNTEFQKLEAVALDADVGDKASDEDEEEELSDSSSSQSSFSSSSVSTIDEMEEVVDPGAPTLGFLRERAQSVHLRRKSMAQRFSMRKPGPRSSVFLSTPRRSRADDSAPNSRRGSRLPTHGSFGTAPGFLNGSGWARGFRNDTIDGKTPRRESQLPTGKNRLSVFETGLLGNVESRSRSGSVLARPRSESQSQNSSNSGSHRARSMSKSGAPQLLDLGVDMFEEFEAKKRDRESMKKRQPNTSRFLAPGQDLLGDEEDDERQANRSAFKGKMKRPKSANPMREGRPDREGRGDAGFFAARRRLVSARVGGWQYADSQAIGFSDSDDEDEDAEQEQRVAALLDFSRETDKERARRLEKERARFERQRKLQEARKAAERRALRRQKVQQREAAIAKAILEAESHPDPEKHAEELERMLVYVPQWDEALDTSEMEKPPPAEWTHRGVLELFQQRGLMHVFCQPKKPDNLKSIQRRSVKRRVQKAFDANGANEQPSGASKLLEHLSSRPLNEVVEHKQNLDPTQKVLAEDFGSDPDGLIAAPPSPMAPDEEGDVERSKEKRTSLTNAIEEISPERRHSSFKTAEVASEQAQHIAKPAVGTRHLSSPPKEGSTDVQVADVTDLEPGMLIEISEGTTCETRVIISVTRDHLLLGDSPRTSDQGQHSTYRSLFSGSFSHQRSLDDGRTVGKQRPSGVRHCITSGIVRFDKPVDHNFTADATLRVASQKALEINVKARRQTVMWAETLVESDAISPRNAATQNSSSSSNDDSTDSDDSDTHYIFTDGQYFQFKAPVKAFEGIEVPPIRVVSAVEGLFILLRHFVAGQKQDEEKHGAIFDTCDRGRGHTRKSRKDHNRPERSSLADLLMALQGGQVYKYATDSQCNVERPSRIYVRAQRVIKDKLSKKNATSRDDKSKRQAGGTYNLLMTAAQKLFKIMHMPEFRTKRHVPLRYWSFSQRQRRLSDRVEWNDLDLASQCRMLDEQSDWSLPTEDLLEVPCTKATLHERPKNIFAMMLNMDISLGFSEELPSISRGETDAAYAEQCAQGSTTTLKGGESGTTAYPSQENVETSISSFEQDGSHVTLPSCSMSAEDLANCQPSAGVSRVMAALDALDSSSKAPATIEPPPQVQASADVPRSQKAPAGRKGTPASRTGTPLAAYRVCSSAESAGSPDLAAFQLFAEGQRMGPAEGYRTAPRFSASMRQGENLETELHAWTSESLRASGARSVPPSAYQQHDYIGHVPLLPALSLHSGRQHQGVGGSSMFSHSAASGPTPTMSRASMLSHGSVASPSPSLSTTSPEPRRPQSMMGGFIGKQSPHSLAEAPTRTPTSVGREESPERQSGRISLASPTCGPLEYFSSPSRAASSVGTFSYSGAPSRAGAPSRGDAPSRIDAGSRLDGQMSAITVAAPLATVGVDINRDGHADVYVTGIDRNRDGIPDALQRNADAPSYAGTASRRGVPSYANGGAPPNGMGSRGGGSRAGALSRSGAPPVRFETWDGHLSRRTTNGSMLGTAPGKVELPALSLQEQEPPGVTSLKGDITNIVSLFRSRRAPHATEYDRGHTADEPGEACDVQLPNEAKEQDDNASEEWQDEEVEKVHPAIHKWPNVKAHNRLETRLKDLTAEQGKLSMGSLLSLLSSENDFSGACREASEPTYRFDWDSEKLASWLDTVHDPDMIMATQHKVDSSDSRELSNSRLGAVSTPPTMYAAVSKATNNAANAPPAHVYSRRGVADVPPPSLRANRPGTSLGLNTSPKSVPCGNNTPSRVARARSSCGMARASPRSNAHGGVAHAGTSLGALEDPRAMISIAGSRDTSMADASPTLTNTFPRSSRHANSSRAGTSPGMASITSTPEYVPASAALAVTSSGIAKRSSAKSPERDTTLALAANADASSGLTKKRALNDESSERGEDLCMPALTVTSSGLSKRRDGKSPEREGTPAFASKAVASSGPTRQKPPNEKSPEREEAQHTHASTALAIGSSGLSTRRPLNEKTVASRAGAVGGTANPSASPVRRQTGKQNLPQMGRVRAQLAAAPEKPEMKHEWTRHLHAAQRLSMVGR